MLKLPEDVQKIKQILRIPTHELHEIAVNLIVETPDLVSMWRTVEKREKGQDNYWVWSFLESVKNASDLPPYHYMPTKDRQELSKKIATLSKQLSRLLKINKLDASLVFADGTVFNGFYFYEEFSESNRARIDDEGTQKMKVSGLIDEIAQRSQKKIADEPLPGKSGKNVRAIRFVRIMGKRNKRFYGSPLNKVIASAANALFDTQYKESDIRKLLSR